MKRTHTAAQYLHVQRTIVEPVTVERQQQFEERSRTMVPGHGVVVETIVFAYLIYRVDRTRAIQRKISATAARNYRGRTPGDTVEETAREMARREAIHLLTEDALALLAQEKTNAD